MGSTQRGRRHRHERRLPVALVGLLGAVGSLAAVLNYRPGPVDPTALGLTIQAQAAGAQAAVAPAKNALGLVLGRTVTTDWGDMQVGITVKAGKLVSALAVKSPNEASQSRRINARALPILYQQTVTSQTARIDGVSGATVSSNGYRQSLQSALDTAHLKAPG